MIEATALISGTRARIMPAAPVEGPDHGVGAVPLGLGRPGEDQEPRDQPADRRDQQDQPPGPGIGDRRAARPRPSAACGSGAGPRGPALYIALEAEQERHGPQPRDRARPPGCTAPPGRRPALTRVPRAAGSPRGAGDWNPGEGRRRRRRFLFLHGRRVLGVTRGRDQGGGTARGSVSQTLSVASLPPETRVRPSGENAIAQTAPECPLRTDRNCPVVVSHRAIPPPTVPAASARPSGEKARLRTRAGGFASVASLRPPAGSQSAGPSSRPGTARARPSGEKARQVVCLRVPRDSGSMTRMAPSQRKVPEPDDPPGTDGREPAPVGREGDENSPSRPARTRRSEPARWRYPRDGSCGLRPRSPGARPSGENASERTPGACRGGSSAHARVSQILTVPSRPAAARIVPSGEKARLSVVTGLPSRSPLESPPGHVPEDDRAVEARRRQPPAVGGEGNRRDLAGMGPQDPLRLRGRPLVPPIRQADDHGAERHEPHHQARPEEPHAARGNAHRASLIGLAEGSCRIVDPSKAFFMATAP